MDENLNPPLFDYFFFKKSCDSFLPCLLSLYLIHMDWLIMLFLLVLYCNKMKKRWHIIIINEYDIKYNEINE